MDKITPKSGAGLVIVGAVLFLVSSGMALWNWSQNQSAVGAFGSMTGATIIIVIGVVWHRRSSQRR